MCPTAGGAGRWHKVMQKWDGPTTTKDRMTRFDADRSIVEGMGWACKGTRLWRTELNNGLNSYVGRLACNFSSHVVS